MSIYHSSRCVINKFIFFVEDDFKSDVDLRIACVILQKQIQIINGDESKVMVPSIIYSLNTSRKAANDLDLENKSELPE